MFYEFYLQIYRMPYWLLAVCAAFLLGGAVLVHLLLKRKGKLIIGIIALACSAMIILYLTLLGRSEPEVGLVLRPGYSFLRATWSSEYLRMVLMNIFVFVPLGISLTLALSGLPGRVVITVTLLTGLAFTVTIEILQFVLGLGCAEVDDVICNELGTFIGMVPYLAAGRRSV